MGILTGRARCLGQDPPEWASFGGTYAMANDNKPRRHPPATAMRGRAQGAIERPFDKWLQKQLHAMYDEITSEPLPDDLLNLIEHDARRSKTPGPSGKK